MRRLGATAVPMPLNEVLPSLQRGVIDGTMSGTSVFVAFKFNDVVKTITVTNDTMLVSLAVVSKVWLDKLPPDLRKIVVDTGRATQIKTNAWEKDFTKGLDQDLERHGRQHSHATARGSRQNGELAEKRRRRHLERPAGRPRTAAKGPRGCGQALTVWFCRRNAIISGRFGVNGVAAT